MALTVKAFLALLAAVALLRFVELLISRRHERILRARGARQTHDPYFRWMVLLHVAVLAGAALEVLILNRPFIARIAIPMAGLFVTANAARWWVIRTLGNHWNVRVMDSVRLGVITTGPFRLVRHPNYTAVFVELAVLPLIHTAWVTALIGSTAHVWVLSRRLAIEEGILLRDRRYRATMAQKPRFLPRLFPTRGSGRDVAAMGTDAQSE